MKISKHTIRTLGEMICGAHGGSGFTWPNFPYRTSSALTQFFTEDCELPYTHSGETRVTWVIDVLTELNEGHSSNSEFPADTITRIIIQLLESIRRKQVSNHEGAIHDVNEALHESGLGIEYKEGKYILVTYGKESIEPTVIFSNATEQLSTTGKGLFTQQFPVGLPFGWSVKPDFSVLAEKGTQRLGYEIKDGLWILRSQYEVYPNFTFQKLESICQIAHHVNKSFKISLFNMNQTETEKCLYKAYGQQFNMADNEVPLLIPQAWIQWHSQSKRYLAHTQSVHADEPFRIDLVAFWNNKRYAILIDDISHYAKKDKSGVWVADEEQYSKNLREERKLRREGWGVFRVSNREVRDEIILQEILLDLKEFIGF